MPEQHSCWQPRQEDEVLESNMPEKVVSVASAASRSSGKHADKPEAGALREFGASLDGLAGVISQYELAKPLVGRVDGQIIGTGEADFTKGNVEYRLTCNGKPFQLLDVPGIEGDEGKYSAFVREAVAKAHLVFYVNGTNKKPERHTAEKIGEYLNLGARVCPIINLRGSADSYEFEEDRVTLMNSRAINALEQTVSVLEPVLGQDRLLDGVCVQGLLGFSSLAISGMDRESTIHPDRERDLGVQQSNYFKYFSDSEEMFGFCQIGQVASVLERKQETYKEDIVESNKQKLIKLLANNVAVLEEARRRHLQFMDKVEPEFKKCRDALKSALEAYRRICLAERKNILEKMFDDIALKANDIISEDFGDNSKIRRKIGEASTELSKSAQISMQAASEKSGKEYQDRLVSAISRLLEDISRVDLAGSMELKGGLEVKVSLSDSLGRGLGLKGLGSAIFTIGSYALAGFYAGTPFGGIGAPIGAAIGAAMGLVMELLSIFMSRERKVRKAQKEADKKILEVRRKKLAEVKSEVDEHILRVKSDVNDDVLSKISVLYGALNSPLALLDRQISMLGNIREKMESMAYGSVC